MADALLFDTDVLIEYLRGRQRAAQFFGSLDDEPLYVSVITVAELYAGVREDEERSLADFLELFDKVPLDSAVARRAGLLTNHYGPTHGTGLADAVIAASADTTNATLVTFNDRHYPMVDNVTVPWSR